MKLKNIFAILGIILFAFASCEGPEVIPPAPEPPPPPPPPDVVYNIPEFTPRQEGEPFNSYRGLVMTGYQGWFCAPARAVVDGVPAECHHSTHHPDGNQFLYRTEWYHYREHYGFRPGPRRNGIDMWPDMREYEVTYHAGGGGRHPQAREGAPEPEAFYHRDGSRALVFSSYDESTVMLHFRWMQQYGIDGAFMQRFVGEIANPQGEHHFNTVLGHAMRASNRYQRAISVMYDLSGIGNGPRPADYYIDRALADAQWIMNNFQLQNRDVQRFYLHENGKPLIAVWGVGFHGDDRRYSNHHSIRLLQGLRDMGFSIMLGVPTYWREMRNDAQPNSADAGTNLLDIIREYADVVMPWFVGRYGMQSFPNFHELIRRDIAWGRANEVEYAPLVFAGSSDLNMYPHHNHRNERHGGQFMWNQVYHSISSGAQMLYLAMFDEIDEGTALLKMLNQRDVPSNVPQRSYWVTRAGGNYGIGSIDRTPWLNQNNLAPWPWPANQVIGGDWSRRVRGVNDEAQPRDLVVEFTGIEDHLPTDHYLWLSGQARKMLRGEIPLSRVLPVRD